MKSEAQRGEIWRIGEVKKKWADHSDVEFIDFSYFGNANLPTCPQPAKKGSLASKSQ